MKINKKIYKIFLIFATITMLLAVYFIWMLFTEIEKNSTDLISAKNDIITLTAQINETNNFKKKYESYKSNLDKIDQLFIDSNNPVDFIKFLEDSAATSQITSQITLTSSTIKNPTFITLQFISKGSFSGLLNFIKKIEAGPYLIEIENLSIRNSNEKDKAINIFLNYPSRNVEATFTIKAFIKK